MRIDLNNALRPIQGFANDTLRLLPSLALALAILLVAYMASKYAAKVVRAVMGRAGQSASAGLLVGRLASYVGMTVGVLIALSTVFPSFQAKDLIQLLGISGVAVGFAFKDIFQNFLAGVIILISRPFRLGDTIAVKGYEGTVEDIQTRATMIRTADNARIVIPNTVLFSEEVRVVTAYEHRRTEVDVPIGYGKDLPAARAAILQAMVGVEGVLKDPAPDVLAFSFGDARTVLRMRFWTASEGNALVARDAVVTAVKAAMDRAGIDLTTTA